MRDLADTLERIIQVSSNKKLIRRLVRLKQEVLQTPIECMHIEWITASEILDSYIPNPLENEETLEIIHVFCNQSKEEVQRKYEKATK